MDIAAFKVSHSIGVHVVSATAYPDATAYATAYRDATA
jgi:hypothetical protein